MFYEWVSAGAIFGIEAFFAVFMFLLCCSVIVGFLAMLAALFKAGDDK